DARHIDGVGEVPRKRFTPFWQAVTQLRVSRLRVYQFHHLGNTTFETLLTFALELEARQSLE
ncbi:hypothetical protein ACQKP7_28790, partial [Pseudomonas frederiksbergensis]|uniref:hypothetical protein n=1 Tax=Pseudomonas frederiksbergensis TaxID=104087 RepID=UPI003D084C1A